MTRIGTPPPIEPLQPAQTEKREAETQSAAGARFAVLYGGTTRFAYARAQGAHTGGSALARQLAALNARKRGIVRRTAQARRAPLAGNEAQAHANSGRRVTRDGDRGGGAGHSGGDSTGGRGDGDQGAGGDGSNAPRAVFRVSGTQACVARAPRGRLQTFVAAQPPDADLAPRLPGLWCEALLALRDEAAAHPAAPIDARLHERFIDLLAAQRQAGAPGETHLGAWRQRLIDASASGAAGETGAAQSGPRTLATSRAGRLNLLLALMLLMYGKPATASMREHAINQRSLQRGAAMGAAAGGET